jgi:hypothetical protein
MSIILRVELTQRPELCLGEAAELLRRREVPNPKEAKALYSQEKIAKAEFESRNA